MKHGYVIAKSGSTKQYFTSSSAYDRPQWLALAEATVYATAELADNAAKKLYKNGSYSARIVSLAEMNLDIAPIDDIGDEELPPEELDADPSMGDDDLGGEDGEDEDDMQAAEQGDEDLDLEPEEDDGFGDKLDSDLESEEGFEGDDETSDDDSDIDEFGDDAETDDADVEGLGDDDLDDADTDDFDLNGGPDENEQEADPRFDDRRLGMASMSPMGSPRRMRGAMESVETIKYKDQSQDTTDSQTTAQDNEASVKVPANVKSDLKAAIADFKKQAEYSQSSDDARASFCLTVVDAMEQLQKELNAGTASSIKMAAVKLSSFMSPITNNVPPSVIKFIYSGGTKPSLKDLFDSKRNK